MIDIETASVIGATPIWPEGSDLKGVKQISTAMVEEMIGISKEETVEREAAAKDKVKRDQVAQEKKKQDEARVNNAKIRNGILLGVVIVACLVVANLIPKKDKDK